MEDPGPARPTIVFVIFFLLLWIIQFILTWGEEALPAIGDATLREWEEKNDPRARSIRRLTEDDRRFAGRIRLIRVCLLLLLSGAAGLLLFVALRAGQWWPIAGIAEILLIAVLWTVPGDRLPRRLALKNPERSGRRILPLFRLIYGAFAPLDWVCRGLTRPLLRLCRIDPDDDPDRVTEEDIRELLDDGEEDGSIEVVQKNMVNNVFAFDDRPAAAIMTPRPDMIAAEAGEPIEAVLQKALEHGYSRIPVYEEDIDRIIGILYVKDLLPYVGQPLPEGLSLRQFLREVSFVPDTKKCDDLFEEMSDSHRQMAVVVDEYGGVAGIVTVEDLLESIVGNMQDEFDHEEEEFRRLSDTEWSVSGALGVEEFGDRSGIVLPDGDYDTVAGFLMDQLGHIPEETEFPAVTCGGACFTVEKMDDRRIERVLISVLPAGETDNDTE